MFGKCLVNVWEMFGKRWEYRGNRGKKGNGCEMMGKWLRNDGEMMGKCLGRKGK